MVAAVAIILAILIGSVAAVFIVNYQSREVNDYAFSEDLWGMELMLDKGIEE